MVFVTGGSSKIFDEFRCVAASNKIEYFCLNRDSLNLSDLNNIDYWKDVILGCDRIILCHGFNKTGIVGDVNRFLNRSQGELLDSVKVNLLSTVKICELALNNNPNVRIVVIGSQAGIIGSFDLSYALSKAAVHKYVEERKVLHPNQQLVCIAPTQILDSRATLRRNDLENISRGADGNPKKKGVTCREIAELVYFLLYVDKGYISNTTIVMSGGKIARM